MGSQFFNPIFRKTSWPSLICRHVLNFLRVKSTFPKCKFQIRSSISSHQMLENWDFSRRSRKAVLDTFLSIFRILRTSKSSQRYENYNTFILMKSQTSFVRAPNISTKSYCFCTEIGIKFKIVAFFTSICASLLPRYEVTLLLFNDKLSGIITGRQWQHDRKAIIKMK